MNELVTIVITTYHRPHIISQAIENALAQTCQKEIIVVDDNGKDTPEQRLTQQEIIPYMDRIQYFVNEVNKGPSYARNVGLNHAKGKYIMFLDDDDEMHPDKCLLQAKRLEELGDSYSCVYCRYTKQMPKNKTQVCAESLEEDVYAYVLGRMFYPGSGSNLLVRTDILKELHGYDEDLRHFEDYELMTRLLKEYKLAFVNQDLLTIHYEVRDRVPSYEDLVSYDSLYFEKVREGLQSLPPQIQQGIQSVCALERWRYALPRKKTDDALKNMKQVGVTKTLFLKYVFYLVDRVINRKSYGIKVF